jgi:hypothetical protein
LEIKTFVPANRSFDVSSYVIFLQDNHPLNCGSSLGHRSGGNALPGASFGRCPPWLSERAGMGYILGRRLHYGSIAKNCPGKCA